MLRIGILSGQPFQLVDGPLWDARGPSFVFAAHGLGVHGVEEPRFKG